jgi:hypothetical protein
MPSVPDPAGRAKCGSPWARMGVAPTPGRGPGRVVRLGNLPECPTTLRAASAIARATSVCQRE